MAGHSSRAAEAVTALALIVGVVGGIYDIGLIGGYIGARLQPRVADRALRLLLAVVAIALAALYIAQSVP